jgi:hypothetical protein
MTREEAFARCAPDSYVEFYGGRWLVVPFARWSSRYSLSAHHRRSAVVIKLELEDARVTSRRNCFCEVGDTGHIAARL